MAGYKFSQEETQNIIKLYTDGKSINKISKDFNIPYQALRNHLSENNIYIRPRTKYTLDEHYFDSIDTPNKAYIMGLLYSDGANTSNYENAHYCISITLQFDDIQILEDIKREINSTAPISIYDVECYGEVRRYCRFNICNKHIAYKMLELGVCPNKTFTVDFPEWLPQELYPHFIRGISDGDGYIREIRPIQATITGTTALCESLSSIISKNCEVYAPIHSIGKDRNENIKTLHVSGKKQVIKYLEFIYNDADLKLNRKYKKYLELIA